MSTPSPESSTPKPQRRPPGTAAFFRLKKQLCIFKGDELGPFVDRLHAGSTRLVEGLLPPRSVNILVGDSGVGKSPLAYHLGLCFASGTPFLVLPVHSGN